LKEAVYVLENRIKSEKDEMLINKEDMHTSLEKQLQAEEDLRVKEAEVSEWMKWQEERIRLKELDIIKRAEAAVLRPNPNPNPNPNWISSRERRQSYSLAGISY